MIKQNNMLQRNPSVGIILTHFMLKPFNHFNIFWDVKYC